jgi:peptidyl-prolyl cis-trans isomerase A (cyclophilin A)
MIALLLLLGLSQAVLPTAAPPTPGAVPSGPRVLLETSLGNLLIGLYPDKAPITVENFLRYARAGHYDGTIFHRVIPAFMAQGGGYDAKLVEKPTRPPIRNEARNGLRNLRGTVAMARMNAADSATAQFFVNVRDNASLDFGIRGAGYAVFGEVLEGMEVVERMVAVPTRRSGGMDDVPVTPIVILRARVVEGAPLPTRAPAAGATAAPKAPTARPTPKPY